MMEKLIEELRGIDIRHAMGFVLDIVGKAADTLESQAREIERLSTTNKALIYNHNLHVDQIAALKAQPSGVVPAALGSAFITCESGDAGYRVVIKSETLQEAQQVHNWMCRLNSFPVSAGGVGERAGFEAWYETTYGISLEPEFRANHFIGYVNDKANHRWTAWQARAALSAPSHGEQVREGWQLVPVELIEHVKHARKLLGGNSAPEWQREKLRQKLTDLLAAAPSAGSQEQGE